MKSALLLIASVALMACSEQGAKVGSPEPLDPFIVQAAETDAQRYLKSEARILAVCGKSVGHSLFLDRLEDGFVEDGIEEGVTVFATKNDANPEILTRDVLREMIVVSEDGGNISRLDSGDKRGLGVWAVQYPATGVVITHNLASSPDGSLIDIWTQNKPRVGPLPARTSTFLSRCETVS